MMTGTSLHQSNMPELFVCLFVLSVRLGQADSAYDCARRDASSTPAQKQDGFHGAEQDRMLHLDSQHYSR